MTQVRQSQSPNQNGGARIEAAFDNDELVDVEMEGHRFKIRSRQATTEKFPCDRCHTVPLDRMKNRANTSRRAHWPTKLRHATPEVMSCSTCHLEGDLNRLRTIGGQPVSFDSSYRVCAQCHFKQTTDWAGGSHGKRVAGWAPPRVVKTCAECHDPHAPAWDQRYPARASAREDKPGHE